MYNKNACYTTCSKQYSLLRESFSNQYWFRRGGEEDARAARTGRGAGGMEMSGRPVGESIVERAMDAGHESWLSAPFPPSPAPACAYPLRTSPRRIPARPPPESINIDGPALALSIRCNSASGRIVFLPDVSVQVTSRHHHPQVRQRRRHRNHRLLRWTRIQPLLPLLLVQIHRRLILCLR